MQLYKTTYNPNTKIWSGNKIPLMYHQNVSMGQIILDSFTKHPNRVVQVNENNGVEVTTDELRIRSIRAAIHLLKFNLTHNDCIGIIATNNHHLAPIVIGALLIGVPIHPLDPLFDNDDISHIYNLSKPNVIFCDHNVYDRVKESMDKIGLVSKFVTFGEKLDSVQFVEDFLQPVDEEEDFIPTQIEDGTKWTAIILCSSGTTGLSKCVCLSHAQVLHKFTTFFPQTSDAVYVCFSSIYWITGIVSLLFGSTTCCKRIITTKKFTAELFLEMVEKYHITEILGPPSNLGLILQHPKSQVTDFSSLRLYVCGGAIVPEDYVIAARKLFKNCKTVTCYGMSELSGGASYNSTNNSRSVGYVSPNTHIKIIDDGGNNLGPNQDGEIIIQCPYTFLGYKSEPELTKNLFYFYDEGWVQSGDIGHFDDEGLLYIVDRKKDILKYRNYVISPSEIEEFIMKLKFVQYVSVVGVPDMLSGDLPAAIVVKKFDAVESDETVIETIHNDVRENLADYKLLRGGVYVIKNLPMTASGKVLKRKVKDIAVRMFEARK